MEQQWTTVVHAVGKRPRIDFKGLLKCKDLILLWVRRNFVAQYKQTVLGPAWAIIQPFFTTVVYSVFFGDIAGLGVDNVPNFIFYLSGTIMWSLFSHNLTKAAGTFSGNAGIMGKVYFPRLVMPIASAISQFISFFIQFGFMLIFFVYYLITDAGLAPNLYILMTPVLLVQTALLGMGFGLIISSLTTKYRDLNMVVGFGVSLWSYCSPVAYDMFSRSTLVENYYALYMLNPMTPIINMFRHAYLGIGGAEALGIPPVDWLYYGISWIVTVAVAALGMMMFSKVEKTFMDTI